MDTCAALVRDYEAGIGVTASSMPAPPDPESNLAATLPVWSLAGGAVAAFAAATDRRRAATGFAALPQRLEPARVAASFSSEKLLRIDGAGVDQFAELSGFFEAADGWVRTHANYPHHRARLLTMLDLPADADRPTVAARIAALPAAEIESRADEFGAIAVRVRTEHEWADSPQGKAAADGPLVAVDVRADSGEFDTVGAATQMLPLRGVRVLDLTRVIAGPVSTRSLALLGADVLRVDPPLLPEIGWQYLDLCQGKRSTLLDLRTDRAVFDELLSTADVLVTGYRPGALEAAGVDAAGTRPGIVHARVSAWGESGPWGARRGFDSIVQAASGISLIEGAQANPGGVPVGALPAQALDHASGYLLAAGVVDALTARDRDGIGRDVRVALARTASWLLAAPGRTPEHGPATPPSAAYTAVHDTLTTAVPALADYPDYSWPARPYGGDAPAWQPRPEDGV
ncbi:CoA transferase [Nocardia otitidiscaviarum]|uniref:CoA transferase n=1 Tax=Nocardia otitidiscaviarum TaxID=1823 RepID=UPI00397FAFFA